LQITLNVEFRTNNVLLKILTDDHFLHECPIVVRVSYATEDSLIFGNERFNTEIISVVRGRLNLT
jgi:hypothetical protein